MRQVEEYINPWVRQSESYSDKHLEFAWQHPNVVRMMSNENPLPPSKEILDAIMEAASKGNLYPDTGFLLRQKIGESVGLEADNVVLGNGSTDVINFVINTFVSEGDEVVIPVPTFSMYEKRTRVNGGVPILVPMKPDFYWDIERILNAVSPKTKMIFLCSPNNPTGNQVLIPDLVRLLNLGIPFFLDEAYYELEETPKSLAYLIPKYPNLIINRTMSKAFGLAGVRVGYAISNKSVVGYLNRMKIPWNVSLLALSAALKALEVEEANGIKRENCIQGRAFLYDEINTISGLRAYKSEGNFVLIDASSLGKSSTEIMDALISRGVFIRPMTEPQMKAGFIRVTVGTEDQNTAFIKVLKGYLADLAKKE